MAPTGDGYIQFVAVRDDARTLGLGKRLYETFAAAAAQRGATALKATDQPREHRLPGVPPPHGLHGHDVVPDYGGSGRTRIVMRRPLPL